MNEKQKYGYAGVVTQFGKIIHNSWHGETAAVSDKKAKSNLVYQFKQEFNLVNSAKVELPGQLYLIEE